MTFTTLTFCIFLAIVFAVYWRLDSVKWQNRFLLVASYFFYGWWDWRFCGLMALSSVADYCFALALDRAVRPRPRKLVVAASCVFNLGLLGFFKYFNFFAKSAHDLAGALGWHMDAVTLNVILPVGISFYTFQSMSYIIDVYRKEISPTHSLLDYMAYVALFPQLVAGPIQRAHHLLPQVLSPRTFSYPVAVDGLRLMLWGFFKKMAIADNLARFVDQAYSSPENFSGRNLAFATVAFAFQIYCDFSGYSDIAIGTASLFGFNLSRNFAFPYFSQSVPEFWRRWHISLSTWFRDYLYHPMGGNRVSLGRHGFNLMATFIISGFWHGAAWNYIIWGGLNGAGMLPSLIDKPKVHIKATDLPGGSARWPSLAAIRGMALTFGFICLTWVFFRARTFHDAVLIISKMTVHLFDHAPGWEYSAPLTVSGMTALLVAFVLVEWRFRDRAHPLRMDTWPAPMRWGIYTILIWFTFLLPPTQSGAIIYFQF